MLNSTPMIILVGSLLGFFSGLGVGGGTLLILWLTVVLKMPAEIARSINLLFFIPSALISSVFRWHQGALDVKTITPAIFAGVASAVLFSLLSRHLDAEMLRKPFGALLLITGIRELLYRPRKAK